MVFPEGSLSRQPTASILLVVYYEASSEAHWIYPPYITIPALGRIKMDAVQAIHLLYPLACISAGNLFTLSDTLTSGCETVGDGK